MHLSWILPASAQRAIRRNPMFAGVLVISVLVRLVLMPRTFGPDFVVWDKAATATLHGINIYAHHPQYPGGPYAYFPLFVYIETPLRWLAMHSAISFTVLGKIPMLVGDIATGCLVAAELRERGHTAKRRAAGGALFLLNPLVLYDSVYYGRFDSLACAALLLSLRLLLRGSQATGLWYAIAVALKTFPVFLLPGILHAARSGRGRIVALLVLVLGAISLPYLARPVPYVHDIVLYDAGKVPQFLSWQHLLLNVMTPQHAKLISYLMLAVFGAGCFYFARRRDVQLYTLMTLLLFIVCSKVVLEQYFIWPLPWLVIACFVATMRIRVGAAALVAILSTIGMVANANFHPWGRSPWQLDVAVAGSCLGFLVLVGRSERLA